MLILVLIIHVFSNAQLVSIETTIIHAKAVVIKNVPSVFIWEPDLSTVPLAVQAMSSINFIIALQQSQNAYQMKLSYIAMLVVGTRYSEIL